MASRNRRSTEFSKREPTYKPKYARLVGSVTGAILLKQIAFWYGLKRDKPFYKFNAPCKHELYEEGDSWEEELGFTRCELNGARAKIGTKITQNSGLSKGDILMMDTAEFDEHGQMTNADKLVIYWTDAERVTWYILNEDLLEDALRKLDLMQDSRISRKSRKSALAGNAENPHYPITEKTPEKTTETTPHIEKPNGGFSRVSQEHPQAQQPSLSLDGLSVPDAENGSQHEKAKKPRTKRASTGNPNTIPILEAYLAALGHDHIVCGEDRRAAKILADAGYLPEQVAAAYGWLVKQEWWCDQPDISLMTLVKKIGGILKKMGYRASPDGSVQSQPPKPNYLTPENLYT